MENYLVIELSKPLTAEDGKTISKLDLSGMEKLTLNDLNEIYDTYEGLGGNSFLPETTLRFAELAASHVTGIPLETLGELNAKDGIVLKNRVRRFFYSAE